MELTDLSLPAMRAGLDRGDFSSEELTRAHLARIEAVEPQVKAFLHVADEAALAAARRHDAAPRRPGAGHCLAGIPVALKDIFNTADMPTTCGSRVLEGYVPAYDATVVSRLRDSGAVLLGKTNLDEFAMGSSCENSAYGPTRNPLDPERVPGGSSGGSAAAVAARETPAALGTDTGGSIRQPAAFCGVVGMKPTYGRVSRCGMVAFASSLDQAGPLARSVEDAAWILESIWGPDPADATASSRPAGSIDTSGAGAEGLVLGLPSQYMGGGMEPGIAEAVSAAVHRLESAGARIEEVELPHTEAAIPTYYLIATAEASANLARFDGVRYGQRRTGDRGDLLDVYESSRTGGFGDEVQRRIMLGTYALSAGYYDAYYRRAQRVRTLIRRDFARAFERVDLIVGPTAPVLPFRLGERIADPLAMYLTDAFTVPASLAGLPALSLPCGAAQGLPVGLQVIASAGADAALLAAGRGIEAALDVPPFRPCVGPAPA